jgi:hypothetical protein
MIKMALVIFAIASPQKWSKNLIYTGEIQITETLESNCTQLPSAANYFLDVSNFTYSTA